MSNCDMCGYEGPVREAIVEGSLMTICTKCSAYGKVVQVPPAKNVSQQHSPQQETMEVKEIIVDNYSTVIKTAREKLQLKQEELASHIQEKVSVIHKLESNQFHPPLELARKLEKYLQVQLVENYTQKTPSKVNLQDKNLTIGDLIKIKKTK